MTRGGARLLVLATMLLAAPARADDAACFDAHEAAQIARKRGTLLKARAELATCGQRACPASVQRDCVAWAVEIAAQQPTYVAAIVGDDGADLVGARITVDGARVARSSTAIEIDPGVHHLRAEVDGRKPVEQAFEMREGEKARRIVVVVPAPPSKSILPPKPRPLAYAFAGVGAVTLGSFITFAILGKSHEHTLADSCRDQCSDTRVDGVRHLYLAADVSLGIAVVAAGAAVVTWLLYPASAPKKRTALLEF